MLIECRDLDEAVLDTLEQSLHARARACNATGGAQIEIERTYCVTPVPMSPDIIARVESAARRLQQKTLMLASGAGHDAMIVAKVMTAGMLFIPSIGGRSHSSAEDSKEQDIVAGCRVFASVVDNLMQAQSMPASSAAR
jgi:N-carbamoyl-L-amino-acid hydrolase